MYTNLDFLFLADPFSLLVDDTRFCWPVDDSELLLVLKPVASVTPVFNSSTEGPSEIVRIYDL